MPRRRVYPVAEGVPDAPQGLLHDLFLQKEPQQPLGPLPGHRLRALPGGP